MSRRALRSTLLWALIAGIGCSGGGGGGCAGGCAGSSGCVAPIPGGFATNQKMSGAIAAQLTPQAMQFFEQNLSVLLSAVLGTTSETITIPTIGPDGISVPLVGTVNVYICKSPSAGQCGVNATFGNLTLDPETAADGSVNMNVTLPLQINTNAIPVEADAPICTITCDISYNQSGPVNLTVTLNLKVDPNWGNILAANVENLNVDQLINLGDLSISGGGGGCGFTNLCGCVSDAACNLANLAVSIQALQTAIQSALEPTINAQVQAAIDKIRCQACDTTQWTANGGCPTPSSNSQAAATCDSSTNLCYVSKSAETCAPAQLGIQGNVGVGTLLAKFGAPADATLQVYDVAGGVGSNNMQSTYVDPPAPNGGIVLGLMGGTNTASVAQCVPASRPPAITTPNPINFEAAAMESGLTPVSGYDMAIAISAEYMNKALYDVYDAGVLCLNIDSSVSSLISANTFGTFLGSLGFLAHGNDVPMLVALRPKNPPTITVGLGADITTSPLLTVDMKDLQLDFYAFIEERYVRIFSLVVPDFNLPLSLTFDPSTGTVTPQLGSLSDAVMGLTETNCDLIDAADCKFFDNGIGALIGLLPLGSLLPSITLPSFDGISLQVNSARGAVSGNGGDYQYLALFAGLAINPPMMERVRPHATLTDGFVPDISEVISADHVLPYAVVQAGSDGSDGVAGYEYMYRVDNGLWSRWIQTDRFEVHSPAFMFEGRHEINVTSRVTGHGETMSLTPAKVEFVVDYTPPTVRFQVDRERGQLTTLASDNVWGDQVTYRTSIDGGQWSTVSATPPALSMADLAAHQSVQVEVTDGSGHSTTATYGVPPPDPEQARAPGTLAVAGAPGARGGCAQSGAPAAALLLLGLFLFRRRPA